MSDLTPETLAELRRLAEAATPGPWEAFGAVDGRRGERWLGVTTDMRATESARAGDVFSAQDCTRQDALLRIAPCDERGQTADMRERDALLDRLAHMREARDAARAEVKRLTAKVAALADWHETKAEKARRFRIEIDGRNPVMDKAAEVHTDAARRLRAALDEEPQP